MWLRASAIELHLLDDPTEAWLSSVYPLWQRSLAERELRSLRLRRRCEALEKTEPPAAAAAASAALHAAADAAAAARYVRERRAAFVAAASTKINTTSSSSGSSSGGSDAPAACLAKVSIAGLAVSMQPPVSGAARCWELLQKLDEGSLQLSSSSSSAASSTSAVAVEEQRFSTITKAQVHAHMSNTLLSTAGALCSVAEVFRCCDYHSKHYVSELQCIALLVASTVLTCSNQSLLCHVLLDLCR
jgi:hypothetical protein